MKFETNQVIPFPLDQVFRLVRDNLPALLPYLPNVRKIETESREEVGPGAVRLVNRWQGKGDIPKVAQKLVQPDKIAWLDTAVWNEAEKTCRWEIRPMFFKDNVACKGVNYYRAEGERQTRLQITGDLAIQTKGIPGVPRLLEKKVAEQIEKFIVKLLTPNMSSLAQGVTRYLQEKKD
jgi:hypothetical protein